jgi:hypothetical protein
VTTGARDGDPRDAGAEQRFLDGWEAVGSDHTADEFHRLFSTVQMTASAALPMNTFTVLLQRDR